ncbi:MAG: hypothetical protein PHP97_04245 [Candidatus Shapirobacteria bacterium]|nr:hypothetical protein [Candidatus Shapirobacteria bacterium]MDD4383422.1 hypothetical protein [Candidatus Shapirobacteria bacterium]
MHFICRSFSGNSESNSWSRYWENDPDDPFLKSTKGHLFALINISSDEEKELNSIGHDINFEFNQNYFNSENNLDILNNLQQSINSIVKNPLYSDYQIDFSLAVILNNQLFLATFGNSKVILKRQNQISLLLNNSGNQIETLTGQIENQDRIFLLTNSFFEKITWQKIKLFLSDPKIENVEENFLSAIFSLKDQKDLAAALIEIEEDYQDDQDLTINPTINIEKPNFNFSKISQIITDHKKDSSVFISHHEIKEVGKRKKISLLLGIILIIGLSCSIYFGLQKNKTQKTEKQYQELKTEIVSQIENINQTKNLSLDSASEAATVAQNTIEKMVALKIHQDEIENFNSQLKTILSQTGSSESYVPDFFYDTSNIVSNPQFKKIIFNDNKIYLLDSINGRIDYLDVDSKSTKSVLISEKIKSAINLTLDKTNLYLMNQDNISLVDKSDVTSKISLVDVKPTDFKFWNGSAYVVDSENQTIWKFTPNSSGFSKAQNWLKNDAKLDLGAISLSINGKIWVLHQNGTVVPYLSGVKEDFTPSQTSQFIKTDNLDVTQEKELLSFVDNDNTIYLYQKSGELLSKYNLGQLKVSDIAFDEKNNVLYILGTDQKIYRQSF